MYNQLLLRTVLSCLFTGLLLLGKGQVVGFFTPNSTTSEWASQHPIGVTMTTAPASNVTVEVVDNGTGSATAGSDYTFTTQTLVFTPAMTYPYIQYTGGLLLTDDGYGETDETINFTLNLVSGPSTLGTSAHPVLLKELDGRLMIHEISQGASGNQEYYELVVWGPPATTVDIRGWVVDDNNGLYNAGGTAISGVGIASGFTSFENDCMWEKVPTGTLITFYNSDDKNASITAADDPKDADENYIHVLPLSIEFGACATPTANSYLDAYASSPDVTTSSTLYFTPNQDPCYAMISLANGGDAAQVRNPSFAEMSGVSYGLGVTNHPRYPTYVDDALAFTQTGNNRSFWMNNLWGNDPYHKQNWQHSSPRVETPAATNNAANAAWIASLLQDFPVPTVNSTYTCHLNAVEYRRYLNPNDEIFAYLRNNTNNNHGSTTVNLLLGNAVVQNLNLSDAPHFAEPNWQVTLASAGTSPSMQVRLYTTPAVLAELATVVNAAYGTAYTATTIVSAVKIYQTTASGAEPRYGSSAQVTGFSTVSSSYGANYAFQANTTLGGGIFALGVPAPPLWAQQNGDIAQVQNLPKLRAWYAKNAQQAGTVVVQSPTAGACTLKWYAVDGRLIERTDKQVGEGSNEFSSENLGLSSGLYLLEVEVEGQVIRQKVVIRP